MIGKSTSRVEVPDGRLTATLADSSAPATYTGTSAPMSIKESDAALNMDHLLSNDAVSSNHGSERTIVCATTNVHPMERSSESSDRSPILSSSDLKPSCPNASYFVPPEDLRSLLSEPQTRLFIQIPATVISTVLKILTVSSSDTCAIMIDNDLDDLSEVNIVNKGGCQSLLIAFVHQNVRYLAAVDKHLESIEVYNFTESLPDKSSLFHTMRQIVTAVGWEIGDIECHLAMPLFSAATYESDSLLIAAAFYLAVGFSVPSRADTLLWRLVTHVLLQPLETELPTTYQVFIPSKVQEAFRSLSNSQAISIEEASRLQASISEASQALQQCIQSAKQEDRYKRICQRRVYQSPLEVLDKLIRQVDTTTSLSELGSRLSRVRTYLSNLQ